MVCYMTTVKVTTDHKWKNLLYGYELPESVLSDFDYIEPEELPTRSFIKYKGGYYDVGDIMRIDPEREHYPEEFKSWHGYVSETFFSGILVRLSDDGEQYQIASYYS